MNKESIYLNLLKSVLTDYNRINLTEFKPIAGIIPLKTEDYNIKYAIKHNLACFINWFLKKLDIKLELVRSIKPDPLARLEGLDWPDKADTMVGIKRLDNLFFCINEIIENNIPGDLIETGVWRGGASIYMKAILNHFGDMKRKIWLADSFAGLPTPDAKTYSEDKGDAHHVYSELAVPMETVKFNFEKYNLFDERVLFLKGWFKDTLPTLPADTLALIRLDGDMYESTWDSLTNLYPKLSMGGFVIIDDWSLSGCRKAVMDYREKYGINEQIIPIDKMSAFWKKI